VRLFELLCADDSCMGVAVDAELGQEPALGFLFPTRRPVVDVALKRLHLRKSTEHIDGWTEKGLRKRVAWASNLRRTA